MGPRPEPDAAPDPAAADSIEKLLAEHHGALGDGRVSISMGRSIASRGVGTADHALLRRMRMPLIVLSEKILAVVVAIRSPDHGVDVLDVRNAWSHQVAKGNRLLMIELDENDRAVDAVIEDAAGLRVADPGHPRAVQESPHFVHLHSCMPVVHVIDVERDQVEQLPALSVGELAG